MSITRTDIIVPKNAHRITIGEIIEPVLDSHPATKGYVDGIVTTPQTYDVLNLTCTGAKTTGTIAVWYTKTGRSVVLGFPAIGMFTAAASDKIYTAALPLALRPPFLVNEPIFITGAVQGAVTVDTAGVIMFYDSSTGSFTSGEGYYIDGATLAYPVA